MVIRVKVFVLWRKIWDMAYLCPRPSVENVLFRIRKDRLSSSRTPKASLGHHIQSSDAMTSSLFHLIGSRPRPTRNDGSERRFSPQNHLRTNKETEFSCRLLPSAVQTANCATGAPGRGRSHNEPPEYSPSFRT